MDQFVGDYQYILAWSVYVAAGCLFCIFWWKVTTVFKHAAWRDIARGLAIVAIFTPWFVGEAFEHIAPALMVVAMDLLLGSSSNGLAATLALLVCLAVMLIALIAKRFISKASS